MSTVARDGASEEGMSSPKKMRNESDDETSSTASDEDVSSSSDDGISSEEAGDLNESESSEEMYNSDVEADPWGVVIHETAAQLRTKHNELVQIFEYDAFSENDTKKRAF